MKNYLDDSSWFENFSGGLSLAASLEFSGQGGLRWSGLWVVLARVAGVTVVSGTGLAVVWVKLNSELWVPNPTKSSPALVGKVIWVTNRQNCYSQLQQKFSTSWGCLFEAANQKVVSGHPQLECLTAWLYDYIWHQFYKRRDGNASKRQPLSQKRTATATV